MQEHKTLKEFARVLKIFNNLQMEEIGVSQLAKALGMTQSKVSRMLASLEKEGLFERNPLTGKYRLGMLFFELGLLYAYHYPLRKIMRPHIEQMARDFQGRMSWSILKEGKVIVVDRIQNTDADVPAYRIGLNLPIHSTCAGKLLLAHLNLEERERLLGKLDLVKFTDNTIVDREVFRENLELIRQNGYSVGSGEAHRELSCVAAPVRDGRGDVVAAINISYVTEQIESKRLPEIIAYVTQKAMFISRQLGY
jgi:IclR family transcriptional regulator, KDG regulon repressor